MSVQTAVQGWVLVWCGLLLCAAAKWGPWSSYSKCTHTCGGGTRARNRVCPKGQFCGPLDDSYQIQPCNTGPCCKRPPFAHPWEKWNDCPVTCGKGVQFRVRLCNTTLCPGAPLCPGVVLQMTQICDEGCCPKDPEWAAWSKWGQCSVPCGKGVRYRERKCKEDPCPKSPQGCPGDFEQSQACDMGCCTNLWGPWAQWTGCNKPCGGGIKTRERKCLRNKKCKRKKKTQCGGPPQEQMACNEQCCAASKWSKWGRWNKCTVSCGGGTRVRTRSCQKPCANSEPCIGQDKKSKACNTKCCHDSAWKSWGPWSECTVSCGEGHKSRQRQCWQPCANSPMCEGSDMQTMACDNPPCCPDPYWSEWQQTQCSVTCGEGTLSRLRSCVKPCGQGKCKGINRKKVSCIMPCCEVPSEWGPWSSYSPCCNKKKKRTRQCVPDKQCPAKPNECLPGKSGAEQVVKCSRNKCPDG